MSKKRRTKAQKIEASSRHVNTQLVYTFESQNNYQSKKERANNSENLAKLASIKKDLYKSLILALLILLSLTVIYLLS